MKLQPVTKSEPTGYLMFCPACETHHFFRVPGWYFNGDMEAPTFSPSIIVRGGPALDDGSDRVCHSFVRNGKIEYLADCTHAMAGQTVEIPDLDEERAT